MVRYSPVVASASTGLWSLDVEAFSTIGLVDLSPIIWTGFITRGEGDRGVVWRVKVDTGIA